jgi:hypothetical protein
MGNAGDFEEVKKAGNRYYSFTLGRHHRYIYNSMIEIIRNTIIFFFYLQDQSVLEKITKNVSSSSLQLTREIKGGRQHALARPLSLSYRRLIDILL